MRPLLAFMTISISASKNHSVIFNTYLSEVFLYSEDSELATLKPTCLINDGYI